MHKQKIYIAGPMTGYKDLNAPAFNMAADILEGAGHCALNPAALPAGLSESEYMDICFAMIRAATAIYMLTGWEQSEGAQAEYHYAKKLGLVEIKAATKIIYTSPPLPEFYIHERAIIGDNCERCDGEGIEIKDGQ